MSRQTPDARALDRVSRKCMPGTLEGQRRQPLAPEEVGEHGAVTSVGVPVSEAAGPGVVVVKVPVTCERGALTGVVSVTPFTYLPANYSFRSLDSIDCHNNQEE